MIEILQGNSRTAVDPKDISAMTLRFGRKYDKPDHKYYGAWINEPQLWVRLKGEPPGQLNFSFETDELLLSAYQSLLGNKQADIPACPACIVRREREKLRKQRYRARRKK